MKKVIIVGAGIAGLSAGIYALQSGFDVTIYEQHKISGGNCTSWRRNGYLFEGGLHWLTGSSKSTQLYQVWKNVGALDDNTQIHISEAFYTYYYNSKEIYLYKDPDKLENHLIDISPEDSVQIKSFCSDIKQFSKIGMPVFDIKGVKVRHKNKQPFSMLIKMLPSFKKLIDYSKISVKEYCVRFKHPAIRALLEHMVGSDAKATSLLFTLGSFASGDGGYLQGGSLTMANNIANHFSELGGEIKYSSRVEKVIIENGKAVGVKVNDQIIRSDFVIIASDTVKAIDILFDTPLQEQWMKEMRKNVKPTLDTFFSIGVETDLSHLPEKMLFELEKPISVGEMEFDTLMINNYASFKGYAPDGCTALTTFFIGDTYEYWKMKKINGEYESEKDKLAKEVIDLVTQKLPQITDKVAVVDVATPLTYERYCGTYRGSWMTIIEKGDKMVTYPSVSENVKGLYFAGQRIQPPGGLPVAVDTGRKAVQYLCRDTGVVFQGKV